MGLLTDAAGFPLMVEAFEGNKAETTTMLPVITSFMAAHQLADVTVVADAGMISEANQHAIEDARLSFILGTRIPEEPYAVAQWAARASRPGPSRRAGLHPALAGNQRAETAGRRDKVIYFQYRADRGRRTLRGSTNGSPRPKRPSRARSRSSGTGSSPWPPARPCDASARRSAR